MTVIGFKSKKDRDKDLIVKKLEIFLALAKKGKFKTILTLGVTEDNEVQAALDGDGLEALGALKIAEQRILNISTDIPPEEA